MQDLLIKLKSNVDNYEIQKTLHRAKDTYQELDNKKARTPIEAHVNKDILISIADIIARLEDETYPILISDLIDIRLELGRI